MKIKRGWAKHVLFIACVVLLAPLLIRSAEKALSLLTKRKELTWNSARQWEEKECWLLLRHVPPDAKTGVWMPGAVQATQTMQKAMKLSYLCAPRRLVPVGFASKQWPEFVLVAQRVEENFLVSLAAQQQAGALGNWYPVETVQTAAGETTLYADERSDDGSPSLARNSSEQVSQELNKIMQPAFRWQDGVWPLVLVILSYGIGHVLCSRVFQGALDTFSKTQQWALRFNLGLNFSAFIASGSVLAGISPVPSLVILSALSAVMLLVKKQIHPLQNLTARKSAAERCIAVIWWVALAVIASSLFGEIVSEPLNDPPGMGVWCWRAKAMLTDGKYPYTALADGLYGAIHQPDYPPLFPSLLMLLSLHGGDSTLDVWSKLLPFFGWLGMAAIFMGIRAESFLLNFCKLAALAFLASPLLRESTIVVTADTWLFFTLLCATALLLHGRDRTKNTRWLLAAFLLAALSWCKREGMLISCLLAAACVFWEVTRIKPTRAISSSRMSGILLLFPVMATAIWLMICRWQGLLSNDLGLQMSGIKSSGNWSAFNSGLRGAFKKTFLEDYGVWFAIAVICVCWCSYGKKLWTSLNGVILIACAAWFVLAPLIFIFSKFPPDMLEWQIGFTLPRLWLISQMLALISAALTVVRHKELKHLCEC